MSMAPIGKTSNASSVLDAEKHAWRRWACAVASATALIVALLILANVLIDPYDVFGTGLVRRGAGVNERYLKVEHLLHEPGRYDAFIIGSSVMGVFDPGLATRLSHHQYYNLGMLGGMPVEALQALQVLKAHGVTIHEVVMGIEPFQFREPLKSDDPTRYPHPLVTGISPAAFKLQYLLTISPFHLAVKLLQARGDADYRFDIEGDGRYWLPGLEQQRRADPAAFARRQFPAAGGNSPVADMTYLDQDFDGLKALHQWLVANGIREHFFFSPLSPAQSGAVSGASQAEFKRRVVAIVGKVPDFSESFPSIMDYYDIKHPLPSVCAEVLRKLWALPAPLARA